MAKDYRNRERPWIKEVIQDRLVPVTYRVMVGDLIRKRHVHQLRTLAGSKVADAVSLANTPLEDGTQTLTKMGLMISRHIRTFQIPYLFQHPNIYLQIHNLRGLIYHQLKNPLKLQI